MCALGMMPIGKQAHHQLFNKIQEVSQKANAVGLQILNCRVHTKLGQQRFSHIQFELSDATVQVCLSCGHMRGIVIEGN